MHIRILVRQNSLHKLLGYNLVSSNMTWIWIKAFLIQERTVLWTGNRYFDTSAGLSISRFAANISDGIGYGSSHNMSTHLRSLV